MSEGISGRHETTAINMVKTAIILMVFFIVIIFLATSGWVQIKFIGLFRNGEL